MWLVERTITLLRFIGNSVLRPSILGLTRAYLKLGTQRYRLVYEGSPDDLFIVTYPKSGTTWLQMIVYQLTTDGEIDFAHIDAVSPHLEETLVPAGRQVSDLPGTPRVVKSHLSYRDIPKGPGRYIYGTRNGLDVVVSYYHQSRKWPPQEQVPLDEFFRRFLAGRVPYGSWFEHVAGWLRNEDGLDVLVVNYEDLSADLEAGVRRIAGFCGIAIDPAAMPRILERCSFAFMRGHDARFAIERRMAPKPADPGPAGEPTFIRKGKVGGWRQELDSSHAVEFRKTFDRWARKVGDERFRVLSGQALRQEPAASGPASGGGPGGAADAHGRAPLGPG
ncbi:MAG: sulfotransferase domain-containing protein [Gemmatimonadota bacterium]